MSPAKIANAPVSYGVFGDLTVDAATTPAALLATMAESGYEGSELGPPAFFGTVGQTIQAFAAAGVSPVGAYVPLHTQGPASELERDLSRMRQTFDELEALGGTGLVILADEGSQALLEHPRHSAEFALDTNGWARLVNVVEAARLEAEARGLATSFHPHISTYVENPGEIERLLDDTQVSLTYDVGHVVLAGGDAVGSFRAWQSRINHIHVKDAHFDVFEQAVSSGRTDFDIWWSRLCTTLGNGDVDLENFLSTARTSGYDGWFVVEQDRAPLGAGDFPGVVRDQALNRAWLAERLN